MRTRKLESILKKILAQPTAPFHEYHVRSEIIKSLQGLKGVGIKLDPFGNLLVRYKRGRARARWVAGAHMDHPGWLRGAEGQAEFLGGVPKSYCEARGDFVKWFGDFGMWDLPACEIREGEVFSRACDDLIGCAVLVAVIKELSAREARTDFHALFTRAEEVGFIGMMHFLESGLYPAGAGFISLETSAEANGARRGAGPVVRVGDRCSVFDNSASAALELVARERRISVQRQLLDRGTCEASAVLAYGIPAAGLSILLDGYHNCGQDLEIVSESVMLADVLQAARLLQALAIDSPDVAQTAVRLRKQMQARATRHADHIAAAKARW